MIDNIYKKIIVTVPILIFYFILIFVYLDKSEIELLIFLEVFLFIGIILFITCIDYLFFANKLKGEVINYITGSSGNASIGRKASGRKYIISFVFNSVIYKKELSYSSLSSYEKNNTITIFFKKTANKIILLHDLIILLFLSFGFLYFPFLYLIVD